MAFDHRDAGAHVHGQGVDVDLAVNNPHGRVSVAKAVNRPLVKCLDHQGQRDDATLGTHPV